MAKDKKFKIKREKPEYDQKLLDLARVTRVVKGGRRFRFRATIVIGNKKGRVGVGVGKGADVSDAMKKAFDDAKKHLVTVPISGNTIPHDISFKKGSAKIMMKPAKMGRGIVAGGAMRAVVEFSGIKDIVSKSLGTSNKLNVARATAMALESLKITSRRRKDSSEEKKKQAE